MKSYDKIEAYGVVLHRLTIEFMLWKSSTMSIAVAVSKTSAGGISILSGKAATVIMASAIVSHLLRLLCITLFINLLHGGN